MLEVRFVFPAFLLLSRFFSVSPSKVSLSLCPYSLCLFVRKPLFVGISRARIYKKVLTAVMRRAFTKIVCKLFGSYGKFSYFCGEK